MYTYMCMSALANRLCIEGYALSFAIGTYKPLWLRLEKNVIENCGSLVSEAMERNLLHVRARSTGEHVTIIFQHACISICAPYYLSEVGRG